jgi:ribosomal protein S18 acetylase RimI-like enzyme
MLRVRDFEAGDAARVSEILKAAFRSFLGEKFDLIPTEHFTPESLASAASSKGRFSETRSFVAEDDGRVLGVIKATAGTNGLGCLDSVGVDPECHAKGVGAALMAKAEEFWAERGQRKIWTCVSAHNKKALFYYLKHDFMPEGFQRDHFIPGVDEIMLGRFLKK